MQDPDEEIRNLKKIIAEKDKQLSDFQDLLEEYREMESFKNFFLSIYHDKENLNNTIAMELTTYFSYIGKKREIEIMRKRRKQIIRYFKLLRMYDRRIKELFIKSESYMNPAEFIAETLQLFEKRFKLYRIKTKVFIDKSISDEIKVNSDFELIFVGLINNALDSLQLIGGKRVIVIKVNKEGKNIILTVTDNGKGIRDEFVDKIWNRGFTTKKNKTGIGLYIIKRILSKHDGKIALKRGKKTTSFIVTFPLGIIDNEEDSLD